MAEAYAMTAERVAAMLVLAVGAAAYVAIGGLVGAAFDLPWVGLALAALAVPWGWLVPARRVLLGGHLPADPRPAVVVATGFGVGRVPRAPGTAGTALGMLVVATTASLPVLAQVSLAAAVFAVGAVAADVASRHHKRPDAPWIVIDEVAGMMIAMIGVPFTPVTALAGFALFRLADVYKPFPARWIDDHVRTGPGTMLDDAVAGLWVLLVLHGARLVAG